MTMMSVPLILAATIALSPLDSGQEARLASWLEWAAAYRECYEPAPFSLRIDREFTAHCIEDTLRQQPGTSPEQRAATDALIAATPQLIGMLNAPAGEKSSDGKNVVPGPASAPRPPLTGLSGKNAANAR
jgi:hypothetical protein